MGRHEIGDDGVSYSVARKIEEKGEKDFRTTVILIRRKCFHFVLRNGHEIGGVIAIHAVALYLLKHIPFIPH